MSSCEIYPIVDELSSKGKSFCIVTEVFPDGKVKRGVISEGKVVVGNLDELAFSEKEEIDTPNGKVKVMMDCVQGNPNVIVIGNGKVARHLVELMKFLNYPVTVVGDHDIQDIDANVVNDISLLSSLIDGNTFVVVANEGGKHYDITGVETAIRSGARYVSLMASRNRAAASIQRMINDGLSEEEIKKRLYSPAGLDLGSKTPQEIA
ncbi:XdhC family protein [Sulfuracidifex tepidarius]|nr:XdhC family protein [Sulfuracidifex tepidarius]